MTIKFKILDVHPEHNQIIVKYYDDVMTESDVGNRTTFALDLPIPSPTGQYLEQFILAHAPVTFFVGAASVKNSESDLTHIIGLKGIEHSGVSPEKLFAEKKKLVKYEIQEFHPESNSAIVKYYTDDYQDGLMLNVGLPLVNGKHPDKVQTDKMIMDVAPVNELERLRVFASEPPEIPSHLEEFVVNKKEVTKEQIRMEQIKQELFALDLQKIRYLADNNKKKLAELNAQSETLRVEYRSLESV